VSQTIVVVHTRVSVRGIAVAQRSIVRVSIASISSIQQPWVSLRIRLSLWLSLWRSLSLPLLPSIVAKTGISKTIVSQTIVVVHTRVSVRGIAVAQRSIVRVSIAMSAIV